MTELTEVEAEAKAYAIREVVGEQTLILIKGETTIFEAFQKRHAKDLELIERAFKAGAEWQSEKEAEYRI